MKIWVVYLRDKWMADEWGLVCYSNDKECAVLICRILNRRRRKNPYLEKFSIYFTYQELTDKVDYKDLEGFYLEGVK